MVRLTRIYHLVFLASVGMLSSCTINIYRANSADLTPIDKSKLVIPARPNIASTMPSEQVLQMSVQGFGDSGTVQYLDVIGLDVQSNVDAYLNCYYQQADGTIIKVFPNRYAARYWVYAEQELRLPDARYFHIVADRRDATESFLCLASSEDVLSQLPSVYQANVFQHLPVENFDAVYALYRQATKTNLVGRVVSYEIE